MWTGEWGAAAAIGDRHHRWTPSRGRVADMRNPGVLAVEGRVPRGSCPAGRRGRSVDGVGQLASPMRSTRSLTPLRSSLRVVPGGAVFGVEDGGWVSSAQVVPEAGTTWSTR